MKIGAEDKKKLAILAGVGVAAIAALVYAASAIFGGGSPAPQPAPAVAVAAAHKTTKPASGTDDETIKISTSAALDPSLKMDAMLVTESLEYAGSGRNIFSASSVPVSVGGIPTPLASARADAAKAAAAAVPTGPPPPPPIDLKYFGIITAKDGTQQAFLLKDDNVFKASEGDIVQRRYKIITISANTVLVEDMTNNNRQTLPRITTPAP